MQRFRKCLLGLPAAAIAVTTMAPAYAATIAYYRFEDGVAGVDVNTNTGTGNQIASSSNVTDSAGNDDPLVAYNNGASSNYSSIVPLGTIPQTGASNALSMEFDGNDDLFTNVNGPLKTGTLNTFTFEAWIFADTLSGNRTFIGRDDTGNPGAGVGAQSLFYLMTSTTNGTAKVRFEFIDNTGGTGTNRNAIGTTALATGTWYHVALVGDGATASIYLNGALEASTAYSVGLFNPSNTVWTVGRGRYQNSNVDYWDGLLDEIRISDAALDPSQFLNAVPEPATLVLLGLGGLCMVARRR